MRIGIICAAIAAALTCAAQGNAARYYQFQISGTTPVTYFDPSGVNPPTSIQYNSTVNAFFDTQVTSPSGLIAQGDGLTVSFSQFFGSLNTLSIGGTAFRLTFNPADLTGTLQSLAVSGSYGFNACDRYSCANFAAGTITRFLGQTFDTPPIAPVIGETITGQVIAVPETSGWILMLAGLGILGWALRRKSARLMPI